MTRGLKHIIIMIGVLMTGMSLYAQQNPMYSMYMFDKMIINPAFTGSDNVAVGTVKHRAQFVGMEGNPVTQTINFHSPIKRRRVGLGVKVVNDKIAVMKNLNASLLYSYHLNFGGGKMSLGLETGIYNRSIDYTQLRIRTLGDEAIPVSNVSSLVPDASWGLYFQKKQFYAGFSQSHLIKAKFDDVLAGESKSKLSSHYYLMAGNVFQVRKYITIEPSFLMKAVPGAPVQFDINTMAYYDDMVGLGVQYRTGDAIMAILRVNIMENLRVSYSFDSTISGLSTYSGGAHELIVSYGIKLAPPPVEKEVHPRYYY